MQIYILKNDNAIGPLKTEEVQALLDARCIDKNQPVRLGDGTMLTAGTLKGIRLAKREVASPELGQAQGDSAVAPMGSLSRDFKGIKRNSTAIANELAQFMKQMKGKSPAEMLGAFAKSTLVRSGVVAAFILVSILILATAIPFALNNTQSAENTTTSPEPVTTPTNTAPSVSASPAESTAPTNQPNNNDSLNPKPVADKLGIGESKEGTPSEPNPFESTDDLLKDLN